MAEKKDGKQFEKFVEVIEPAFANEKDVTIEAPLRLRDKDTGKLREHDIVIKRKTHYGENLTSVECKDKGRPVGVEFVEQFSKKCEKTGVHHGVIVSATGFYETGKTKAKALNIACMTLEEAEGHDWIGDTFIVSSVRHFQHIDVFLECLPNSSGAAPVSPPTAFLEDGDISFDVEAARRVLVASLPEEAYAPPHGVVKEGQETYAGEGLYVIDANGGRFDVKSVQLRYKLLVTEESHPFSQHTYSGEAGEYEIASGDLVMPGVSAKLMMIRSGQGIQVSVATNPVAKPKTKSKPRAKPPAPKAP